MTALAQARREQATYALWLIQHADWRSSDELVEVTGYGLMRKDSAWRGMRLALDDAIDEEILILREGDDMRDTKGGPHA